MSLLLPQELPSTAEADKVSALGAGNECSVVARDLVI